MVDKYRNPLRAAMFYVAKCSTLLLSFYRFASVVPCAAQVPARRIRSYSNIVTYLPRVRHPYDSRHSVFPNGVHCSRY